MWRRASVVRVVDVDARGRRRAQMRGDLEELLLGVLWTLFGWRVELLGRALILAVERLLANVMGEATATGLVIALLAAALAWPPIRRRALRLLYAMRVRRAWSRAAIDAGVASGPFRCPAVRSVDRAPAG